MSKPAAEKPEPSAQKEDSPAAKPASGPARTVTSSRWSRFFALREEIPLWQALAWGLLCLAVCAGIWWLLTRQEEVEERVVSPTILPSPQETFADFHSLWFERELTRNTWVSLRRVVLGFALAAAVGIPLGVLCGCFAWTKAFFAPLTIFGRNIPIAALIGLTFCFFGIYEFQKVMFIFIACVAFIVDDTARAVRDVSERYVDTAYTLGASRRQIILKVLVPLALPSVFNSMRLLFGLAFGYIMLAETIKSAAEAGGLGYLIRISERRQTPTFIILILLIIPVVALAIDRLLYWVQRELFPYQYGGSGVLHRAVRFCLRLWDDLKGLFFGRRADTAAGPVAPSPPAGGQPSG